MSHQNFSNLTTCKADVANGLINTTADSNGFLWQKNHFEVAKCLKRNSDILITRPDKGAGVLILNRTDYITKMTTNLDDTSKFLKISELSFDDTHKFEIKLQKRFLELSKKKIISRKVYELIRPIGLQRPRIYGLPKIDKSDIPFATDSVPLRSTFIGQMVNSRTQSCFSILFRILCGRSIYFFFHDPSTPSLSWHSIHGVLWYYFTVY